MKKKISKRRRVATPKARRAAPLPKQPTTPPRLSVGTLPRFAAGDGNPIWGSAYVERSAVLQIRDGYEENSPSNEGVFTLSADPRVAIYEEHGFPESVRPTSDYRSNPAYGLTNVRVALSEGGYVVGKRMQNEDFNLEVSFGQRAMRGAITLEQLLSFEEAVRATLEAARQTGILPVASKHRRRA